MQLVRYLVCLSLVHNLSPLSSITVLALSRLILRAPRLPANSICRITAAGLSYSHTRLSSYHHVAAGDAASPCVTSAQTLGMNGWKLLESLSFDNSNNNGNHGVPRGYHARRPPAQGQFITPNTHDFSK
jgi:hypothetical protein